MIAVPATGTQLDAVISYMHEKTGGKFDASLCSGFAVLSDNKEFVAGIVLSNYRTHDIEISCATESSIAWRPHVMKAVFQYVFGQLSCVRCTAIVTKGNKRCREFLNDLGFTLEGNVRNGYDGKRDALIYGLLAAECRYFTGVSNE
jgi:RimJ/RimL family protein N-acetyltransferase